ncbi:uncharacterized protein [Montipora foliosa]|uniref:uncharacterized protein isoform X2 n=1 Tax=Montipora foliosa TaxID=591990 RepID=UPI0035F1B9BE
MELGVLSKGLEACSVCNEPLQLKNITEEKRYGLASLLYVQCECSNINAVYTGKSHRPTGSHHGLPIGHSLNTDDSLTRLVASYDMAWQRRSNGRTYNSLSGHGSLIGKETGKIIGVGTRITACRVCDTAASSQKEPKKKHDCRVNWDGSSKGMEPNLAVEMLNTVKEDNFAVTTLIGDDDTTTMANVRQNVSHTVEKWSDINHSKKSLGSRLYNLQKQHKARTTTVIKYLQKCFAYALCQNKGMPEEIRMAIESIIPHAFREHESCGSRCQFLTDPDTYKPKSLPKGLDLKGEALQGDLTVIFSSFAKNAEKLAPCGSTLSNESFNNTVASKAPKARHYSGSESLDFHVKAATCQKNVGHNYIPLVSFHSSLHLTPKAT